MAEVAKLDHILSECFLAVGQAVGTDKTLEFDVVTWWHQRYRRAFHHAMTTQGASWTADRGRITAVGRYLGQRVVEHTGPALVIARPAAARASEEVEHGCRIAATRAFTPAAADTTSVAVAT